VVSWFVDFLPLLLSITREGFNSQTENDIDAEYTTAFTSPACGIGYFLVFLYVQPVVREKLFVKGIRIWNKITCSFCLLRSDNPTVDLGNSTERDTAISRISSIRYAANNDLLAMIANDSTSNNQDTDDWYQNDNDDEENDDTANKDTPLSRKSKVNRKSEMEMT
jgi:hypothetical protein